MNVRGNERNLCCGFEKWNWNVLIREWRGDGD